MARNFEFLTLVLIFLMCMIFVNKISLMSMLITLEILMFLLLSFIMFIAPMIFNVFTIPALMMCFAASGAAVGLTLLVSMSRLYGNDMISSLL